MLPLQRADGNNTLNVFVHMPVTGGTTLWAVIERQYGSRRGVRIRGRKASVAENIKRLEQVMAADRGELQLVGGHIPFDLSMYTDRPLSYFTMLRDPVQRVLSIYHKALTRPRRRLHDELTRPDVDMVEGVRRLPANVQTRILAGIAGREAVACKPEHLDAAIHNLINHIDVVCLTERYDESLILLTRTYNWCMPYYIRHNVGKNKTKKKDAPDDVIDAIREANRFDIELYECARQRFEAQIEAQGESFHQTLNRFRRDNARRRWRVWLKEKLLGQDGRY